MTVIAIANQKGGVGKTTTTVSLSYDLAQRGFRILAIDLDSQGHLAIALGHKPTPGLFNLLIAKYSLDKTIQVARRFDGQGVFDYIPSDKSTAVAKKTMAGMDFREYALADVLEGTSYDFVLMDCAPSLDILHTAALVAADWLLMPTECQHLSMVGLGQIIASMAEINRRIRQDNPTKVLGVLPTFYERVTTESHTMLKLLVEQFKELVLPPIPKDIKLAEAPAHGLTVWEYAPNARAAIGLDLGGRNGQRVGGYRQLTDRVLEITGVKR